MKQLSLFELISTTSPVVVEEALKTLNAGTGPTVSDEPADLGLVDDEDGGLDGWANLRSFIGEHVGSRLTAFAGRFDFVPDGFTKQTFRDALVEHADALRALGVTDDIDDEFEKVSAKAQTAMEFVATRLMGLLTKSSKERQDICQQIGIRLLELAPNAHSYPVGFTLGRWQRELHTAGIALAGFADADAKGKAGFGHTNAASRAMKWVAANLADLVI